MAGKKAALQCLFNRGINRSKGIITRGFSGSPEGLPASSSSSHHLITLESQRSAHKYVSSDYYYYYYLLYSLESLMGY